MKPSQVNDRPRSIQRARGIALLTALSAACGSTPDAPVAADASTTALVTSSTAAGTSPTSSAIRNPAASAASTTAPRAKRQTVRQANGAVAATAQAGQAAGAPNELVVQLKPSTARFHLRRAGQSAALDHIARLAKRVRSAGPLRAQASELLTVELDPSAGKTVEDALSELRRLPEVEHAELNYRYMEYRTPNDPAYSQQGFYSAIAAPAAWDRTIGSRSVVVAVIDSGVATGHPDLSANKWQNTDEIAGDNVDNDNNGYIDDTFGYDFVTADPSSVAPGEDPGPPDNNPDDFHGHGTHVAGLVGASGNNGISGTGVAWTVSLMPLRAGYRNPQGLGELQLSDIATALRYAADNGAQIVNMSFGSSQMSLILADALAYAASKGVLLVAAAGNEASALVNYPAANEGVLSVAATDHVGNLAGFSSYGAWVDLAAPGVSILSTAPGGGMTTLGGTSMASPLVAGTAALIKALNPSYSAERIAQQLTSTSIATASDAIKPYGAGLVNADRALSITTPPVLFKVVQSAFEELSGDGDGFLEAGERGRAHVGLKNFGAAQGLSVALSSTEPGVTISAGVTLPSVGFTRIASAAFDFTLPASLPVGKNVSFSANLSWSGGGQALPVLLEGAPAFGSGRVLHERYALEHSVTTLPGGAVVVVGDSVGGGSPQPVFAAVRSPSGVWAPTVTLSGPSNAGNPKVSVAPNGSADVVYERNMGSWNSQIFYRRYDAATGTWSTEEQVTTDAVIVGPGRVVTKLAIASDRAGRVHVVWVDSGTSPPRLRHAVRSASGWDTTGVITSFTDAQLNGAEVDLYVLADDSRKLVFRLSIEGGDARSGTITGTGTTWQASQPLTPLLVDRSDALFRDNNVYVFARRTFGVDPIELLRLSGASWETDRVVGSGIGGHAFWLFDAGTAKGPNEKLGLLTLESLRSPAIYSSGFAGALSSVRAINRSELLRDNPRLAFDGAGAPHASATEYPPTDFWIDVGRVTYYSPVQTGVTFPSKPVVSTSLSGSGIVASWRASHSSGIASYSYAVGTAPGLNDVSRWSVTRADEIFVDLSARPISPGELLYVSVRALSNDGYLGGIGYSAPLDAVPVRPIPGRIEAEQFDRYKDNDAAHHGNCGSGPVDAEATADPSGGGCNVGWTGPGEWLEYDVRLDSEQRLDFVARVASANAGAAFHLELDGVNISGAIAAPSGGWQAFQDRVVPGVRVSAGRHVLRLVWDVGGVNVNYIHVKLSPPSGVRMPAKIEAENYVASFDTTAGNAGGACPRPDNVDKEITSDTGGGCNIGWTASGEWLEYEIYNPVPRSFDITARLASTSTNKRVRLALDGASLGTLTAPSAGWQAFQDRTLSNVALPAGSHILRMTFETDAVNVNYLNFVGLGPEPTQTPIPATLEAEAYDRYFDSTPGNSGGQCGGDDVDKVTTQDPTGGVCHVTAVTGGEWLEYDIYAEFGGNYEVTARIASAETAYLHYEIDGAQVSGYIVAPGLGATTFVDRPVTIDIPGGSHRLRVFFDSSDINLNYLRVE